MKHVQTIKAEGTLFQAKERQKQVMLKNKVTQTCRCKRFSAKNEQKNSTRLEKGKYMKFFSSIYFEKQNVTLPTTPKLTRDTVAVFKILHFFFLFFFAYTYSFSFSVPRTKMVKDRFQNSIIDIAGRQRLLGPPSPLTEKWGLCLSPPFFFCHLPFQSVCHLRQAFRAPS